MRIAIFTQPLYTNYGGILQAYALQTLLEKNGHSVVVINRKYNFKLSLSLLFLRIASFIKCVIRYYLFRHKEVVVMNPLSPYYHTKWHGYDVQPFVSKQINQSRAIYSSKKLRQYLENNKFDCYIVGSDQVWRPSYSPCITDFFLKEVPSGANALKIVYAASFGSDKWEFSEEETRECAELAKRFDAVSLREDSGVALCLKYFGVKADHLLDPTMLLYKEDYIRLFESMQVHKSTGNLFCYILDESTEASHIIKSFVGKGYIPCYATVDVAPNKKNQYPYQLLVEEWLRGIYDAELIITDSFHACVFAILFEKRFIVVGNTSRGNTRFDSLLNMFGLNNRKVDSYRKFLQIKESLLDSEDIRHAQNLLSQYRRESMRYFEKVDLLRV